MSTFLTRVRPPDYSAVTVEILRLLKVLAHSDDSAAAARIRTIQQMCQATLEQLPNDADPASSRLAARLLKIILRIRKYGRGGGKLGAAIRKLRPLTRKTFPKCWLCATAISRDANYRHDDEMVALIDEICASAPSVRKNFDARIREMSQVGEQNNRPDLGLDFRHYPKALREFTKLGSVAENIFRKYALNQAKKVAEKKWIED